MSYTRVVWKFPLEVTDHVDVVMPVGAKLLNVEGQGEKGCVWALVDPDAPREVRRLRIAGTGHVLTAEETEKYIGSFQLLHGALVFHVFDLAQDPF